MIGRITLPKTTSVSLDERFSSMRELREKQQQQARFQHVQLEQSSSEAGRHLAQQMDVRPAVRAALAPQQPVQTARAPGPPQKRLHVKQRLAIQARLGVLRNPQVGGGLVDRLGRGRAQANRLQVARSPDEPRRGQRGVVATRVARGRGRASGSPRTTFRERGSIGRAGATTASRGRGTGRGRGASRGRGAVQADKMSKEDLDKQLDAYMAGTKGQLDAELDAYMKEAAV